MRVCSHYVYFYSESFSLKDGGHCRVRGAIQPSHCWGKCHRDWHFQKHKLCPSRADNIKRVYKRKHIGHPGRCWLLRHVVRPMQDDRTKAWVNEQRNGRQSCILEGFILLSLTISNNESRSTSTIWKIWPRNKRSRRCRHFPFSRAARSSSRLPAPTSKKSARQLRSMLRSQKTGVS